MPVQFEEDRPFSETGLPPEKPKALVKFLMDEGVAWSPTAAKIELIIIAIVAVIGTFAVLFYREQITNTKVEVKYDVTKDPMVNVVRYEQ